MELPPRARRIQVVGMAKGGDQGTTSACAENTTASHAPTPPPRNYLRVRGEYLLLSFWHLLMMELPPRARRIRAREADTGVWPGTTSACAENTGRGRVRCCPAGNYLRVRGEYLSQMRSRPSVTELPPRARRIHHLGMPIWESNGTTSACAENTSLRSDSHPPQRNYLRVRGEYSSPKTFLC